MSGARDVLRKAQAALAGETDRVSELAESLEKASELVRETREKLQSFDGLDERIAKWRAKKIRAGEDSRILPEELKADMAARAAAREDLEQYEQTAEIIADELDQAKKAHERSARECRPKALAILREHAESIAKELEEVNRRQWELEFVLKGYAYLKEWTGAMWVHPLPSQAAERAINGYSPLYPGGSQPMEGMVERWRARIDALLSDPDARLDDLGPVLPSDCFIGPRGLYEYKS